MQDEINKTMDCRMLTESVSKYISALGVLNDCLRDNMLLTKIALNDQTKQVMLNYIYKHKPSEELSQLYYHKVADLTTKHMAGKDHWLNAVSIIYNLHKMYVEEITSETRRIINNYDVSNWLQGMKRLYGNVDLRTKMLVFRYETAIAIRNEIIVGMNEVFIGMSVATPSTFGENNVKMLESVIYKVICLLTNLCSSLYGLSLTREWLRPQVLPHRIMLYLRYLAEHPCKCLKVKCECYSRQFNQDTAEIETVSGSVDESDDLYDNSDTESTSTIPARIFRTRP